jgi:cell division septum initiation protein DivIVA
MSRSEELPPEPRPPSTNAAERLAAIVDAAERAALGVIDDAEKEARRYLEEAHARADLIVAERLREAADVLERQRGAGGAEPRLRPVESEPAAAEEEEPEQADDAPPPPLEEVPAPQHSGSAAARLLATQMAVSGAGRKEIEMRLRNGFDIEDTSEILDAILGPEE